MNPNNKFRFVRSCSELQTSEIAESAISNHLYIEGWALIDILNDAVCGPQNFKIAAAYHENKIIGVACLELEEFISVFVLPEYRNQGVATRMFELLHIDETCSCFIGEPQSQRLFEKFNVDIMPLVD